jgi:predicted O-methyltransferase YrrM
MITLEQHGRDARATTTADPYEFYLAYARCFACPQTAMDKRHIFMLYDVLRSHPFEQALEIGCFNGASSTAFVEAINKGASFRATFCDVSPTHSLSAVINNCRKPDQVRFTQQPSWMVLDTNEPFDFIFVDAAHDLDSVSLEIKHLVRRRPLCVVAHDTNATAAGYSKCEGAQLLKETFKANTDYYYYEDSAHREGERTERGLFLATTDYPLYRKAIAAFDSRA